MPVNLSIKNAPDQIVQRLRERAERHHRSLQGELLAIIKAAVREDRPATPAEILAEVRRLGLHTPSEAADWVRADRDLR
jgi:plasmid stability protein